MIEVEEMGKSEIRKFLAENSFGHLGCARDAIPYVVPSHYAYKAPNVYIFTTEGKKSEMIDANPQVCLEVENVSDKEHWSSVVLLGKARQVKEGPEQDKAIELITKSNPSLTPAISVHWMDGWVRENIKVVYCIEPRMITGRKTIKRVTTPSGAARRRGIY